MKIPTQSWFFNSWGLPVSLVTFNKMAEHQKIYKMEKLVYIGKTQVTLPHLCQRYLKLKKAQITLFLQIEDGSVYSIFFLKSVTCNNIWI